MNEKNGFLRNLFLCYALLLCLAAVLLSGCRTTAASPAAPSQITSAVKYTKYNIHAQQSRRDIKASYAGYVDPGTGHIIIPAGSRVEFSDSRARRSGFVIKVIDTGQEVFFEYHRDRMQMSEQKYIAIITTDQPVSLDHFSEVDRKGIESGKVYTGMSREGVLTALGYPAVHGTPSLENDRWTYWRNRFVTMAVEFDPNGYVRNIVH